MQSFFSFWTAMHYNNLLEGCFNYDVTSIWLLFDC